MPVQFWATIDGDSVRKEWMPADANYLLPASSFLRKGFRTPALPEGARVAVDWGGFVVQSKWQGEVRYSIEDYIDWLTRIPNLEWAALWDLPCEPQLAPERPEIRRRQRWTHDMARWFIDEYADCPWAWVPTVQGQDPDDYRVACDDLEPLIRELAEYYRLLNTPEWKEELDEGSGHLGTDRAFRIGIGSLCARKDVNEIREIVEYVASRFPDIRLHLWGVKVAALKDWPDGIPANVASTDSAAWNGRFKSDIDAINARMGELGMTQREYGYRVQLPKYLGSFAKATRIQRRIDWDVVEEAAWVAAQPDAAWHRDWTERYSGSYQGLATFESYSVWSNPERTPRRRDLAARVALARATSSTPTT